MASTIEEEMRQVVANALSETVASMEKIGLRRDLMIDGLAMALERLRNDAAKPSQ